jgi:tetratricopeptide (TPR) repeat protein
MSATLRVRVIVVALATLTLLAVGSVLGLRHDSTPASAVNPTAGTTGDSGTGVPRTVADADQLAAAIARAQQRLRDVPGDYPTWAALGSAYLEQARIVADPGYYPKAEAALRRSLALRPDNNPAALTGLGALANARHDFAAASVYARRALVIDPYDADAYGVLTDAQTQLGNAPAASAAVQHMLDLRPGLAAYARASYDLELHGRIDAAKALMRSALDAAVDRADVAFCRFQLGELDWAAGRLDAAGENYRAGLAADPSYLPLTEGVVKVAAARGDAPTALRDYASLTAAYPSPAYLIEYADLLRANGQSAAADAQLAIAAAALRLFVANGGIDDLGAATLALETGRPADAVRDAMREWSRRHFTDVADVLSWALHQTGQDRAALDYARQAGALGARSARYAYHLGMIELALGQRDAARRDLRRALFINPHFSPIDAPAAMSALTRLGAA